MDHRCRPNNIQQCGAISFSNERKKETVSIYLTRVLIVSGRSTHVRLRDRPEHGAFVIRDNRYIGILQPLRSSPNRPVFSPSDHHPRFIGECLIRVSVARQLDRSNAVWKNGRILLDGSINDCPIRWSSYFRTVYSAACATTRCRSRLFCSRGEAQLGSLTWPPRVLDRNYTQYRFCHGYRKPRGIGKGPRPRSGPLSKPILMKLWFRRTARFSHCPSIDAPRPWMEIDFASRILRRRSYPRPIHLVFFFFRDEFKRIED